MRNKKRFAAFGMAIMLTVSALAGCNSGGGNGQTEPKTEENNGSDSSAEAGTEAAQEADSQGEAADAGGEDGEKSVITIWSQNRHDADFIEEKIAKYNAENTDHVEVEYEIYTENYTQALDMAFQNNTAPDIITHQDQVYQKYVQSGKFADLNAYMDDELLDLVGNVLYDGINVVDGQTYFIPVTGTTGRLFYNVEIFDRCGIENPPETIEEMVTVAKTITEQLSGEGIYGFASNAKNPTEAFKRSISYQMQRESGISLGYDFAEGTYDFSSYAPILEAWRELLSPECAFPGCESLDMDPLRTQFAAGNIGMYISFTHAEPGVYENQFPMEQEWACVQIPTSTGEPVGAQGYIANGGMLLNAEGSNPDLAWKVYRDIYLSEEFLVEYYEAGLGISILSDIVAQAQPAEVYQKNEALLIGATDHLWPLTPHEVDAGSVIIEGLDMYATFSAMLMDGADIESGLEDLTNRYNQAYEKALENGDIEEVKVDDFDPMKPIK